MRILTIDTATPFGVLGLTEDGMPKGEIRFSIRPGGSERLPLALQQLLEQVEFHKDRKRLSNEQGNEQGEHIHRENRGQDAVGEIPLLLVERVQR